jgi:hypothetical protein
VLKKWVTAIILASLLWLFVGTETISAAGSQLIIINKQNNQMAYYEEGKLVKAFKVATGRKPSYTPEGKFKIVNKIKNRPYYKEKIKGGDPRNPLGNRWLGINARGTWGTTYAIHGNNNAASIGKYVSSGCIRMYNNEVSWLFDRIKINTPVIITKSKLDFHSIATANGFKVTGSAIPVSSKPEPNVQTLKRGSRGEAVKKLQTTLTALGYNTNGIDGIFGSGTEKAVRQFQQARSLLVDGIAGPATQKALYETK